MHKHQKLFSGANAVRPLKGLLMAHTKVRPLKGAADEIAQQFQSVGLKKASSTTLANNPKLTILKLTGTACLTLALISILTINLINSNYYSPKLANAVSTNTATIANTTNASNASAASLSSASASAFSSSSPYVSLSLSSATGSSDPSNGSNIAIQLPDAGGLATGSHTLTIKTNAVKGYTVTLSSNSEQTGLVNTDNNSNSNSSSNNGGSNTTATTTIPTITTNGTLANNTWGYSLTKPSDNNSSYIGIKPKSSPDTILESNSPTGTDQVTDTGKQQAIYYGVRVDSPNTMKAGGYTAEVVYTATANIPLEPTMTSITPNTYNLSSTGSGTTAVAITGTNLDSTYEVYIDLNNNGQPDDDEQCTSIVIDSSTRLACNIPIQSTINPGSYDVHVFTQGGKAVKVQGFTYTKQSFKDITYMQDMTSAICNVATTPNASATQIDSTGEHSGDKNWVPEKTMVDKRDSKSYKVRKLADGNCWMVENLALGSSSTNIQLTSQDTDLNSKTQYDIGETSEPQWVSLGLSPIVDHSRTSGWQTGMGYLYNANTANAGSRGAIGKISPDSICPKGWRLPAKDGTSSYTSLLDVYDVKVDSAGSVKLRSSPLIFTYAGLFSPNMSGERLNHVGESGYYWTSVFSDGYDTAWALSLFSSGAEVYDGNSAMNGGSVRCVAR